MAKIKQNFENRVRKLPKPSNAAQALQPLFEATSNGYFAIDDLNDSLPVSARTSGLVRIAVTNLADPDGINIEVTDTGIGLDHERFDAFCVMDTEFKRDKGGKGVGRLFWLDAFRRVNVNSSYMSQNGLLDREFEFRLTNEEQIVESGAPSDKNGRGTTIQFKGLRNDAYRRHFPKRSDTFLRYFSSHFIADFLVGSGPKVMVDIDGEITEYPKSVSDLVVGSSVNIETIEHEEFGILQISGFFCHPDASKGLEGMHQLHLLANSRTVSSREIDRLIGIHRVEREGLDDLVFHACVSGEYLDQHVNEGRTAFVVEEKKLKELARFCCDAIKIGILPEQIDKYTAARLQDYRSFIDSYPIYAFADEEVQLGRVPFGARTPEEFAAGLVKHQVRGEEKRKRQVGQIIDQLEGEKHVPENFAATVVQVAEDLKASEQRALAHHVVKRKLVLEMMERLILKIRKRGDDRRDYHLEETLHTFICPMRVVGNDMTELEPSPHDLWIVDERLAFTRSFSSDTRLDKILAEHGNNTRPDLLIWDLAHGLGVIDSGKESDDIDLSEPLRKMMVVEFKRPGRRDYKKVEDDLQRQVTKYLRQLKGGEIGAFDGRRVRFAKDCQFFCYVVADIVGDLEEQLDSWNTTANGEGRFRQLGGAYEGSTIEVIQWTDLINDAWARNMATLTAAGLRRGDPIVR